MLIALNSPSRAAKLTIATQSVGFKLNVTHKVAAPRMVAPKSGNSKLRKKYST